jgi:transcriptional regulator with XRE-family HTH domain
LFHIFWFFATFLMKKLGLRYKMFENDSSVKAIGMRLRLARNMANLSRNQLAAKAEVAPNSVTSWEHGKNPGSMSQRNMKKIIDALQTSGVSISENWLKDGIGQVPQTSKANKITSVAKMSGASPFEMLSSINKEIELFTVLNNNSVIIQIKNNTMDPFFKIGDWVGGIWQESNTVENNQLCIIHLNNKLQVRWVKKASQEGVFDISFHTIETDQPEPFQIKNVPLNTVAPIIRVWRI